MVPRNTISPICRDGIKTDCQSISGKVCIPWFRCESLKLSPFCFHPNTGHGWQRMSVSQCLETLANFLNTVMRSPTIAERISYDPRDRYSKDQFLHKEILNVRLVTIAHCPCLLRHQVCTIFNSQLVDRSLAASCLT